MENFGLCGIDKSEAKNSNLANLVSDMKLYKSPYQVSLSQAKTVTE